MRVSFILGTALAAASLSVATPAGDLDSRRAALKKLLDEQ
jgi:hypothetical protein